MLTNDRSLLLSTTLHMLSHCSAVFWRTVTIIAYKILEAWTTVLTDCCSLACDILSQSHFVDDTNRERQRRESGAAVLRSGWQKRA